MSLFLSQQFAQEVNIEEDNESESSESSEIDDATSIQTSDDPAFDVRAETSAEAGLKKHRLAALFTDLVEALAVSEKHAALITVGILLFGCLR
jgi:hypothetical protein